MASTPLRPTGPNASSKGMPARGRQDKDAQNANPLSDWANVLRKAEAGKSGCKPSAPQQHQEKQGNGRGGVRTRSQVSRAAEIDADLEEIEKQRLGKSRVNPIPCSGAHRAISPPSPTVLLAVSSVAAVRLVR